MSDVTLAYVVAGFVLVCQHWGNARLTEDDRATERRIGWAYGYGAGYTDATGGREYDLTPPEDGRLRGKGA